MRMFFLNFTKYILVICAFLVLLSFLLETYIYFTKDPSISISSYINRINQDSKLQIEILKAEIEYRNRVFKKMDKDLNLDSNDTLTNYNQFLLFKAIDTTDYTYHTKIEINNSEKFYSWFHPRIFTEICYVDISFNVDKNRVQKLVLNEFDDLLFSDLIKYGIFIESNPEVVIDYSTERIIYVGIPSLLILLILLFWITNTKHTVLGLFEEGELKANRNLMLDVKKKLSDLKMIEIFNSQTDDNIELKESLRDIEKNIEELQSRFSKIESIYEARKAIIHQVEKSEQDTKDIFNRTTLMLIIGLGIATLGILVFYISLPEYGKFDIEDYLLRSFRPIFTLFFIESIAFYMLKQYRIAMQDYKEFYEKYENRSSQRIMYDLLESEKLEDKMKVLIEDLKSKSIELGAKDRDLEIFKPQAPIDNILK